MNEEKRLFEKKTEEKEKFPRRFFEYKKLTREENLPGSLDFEDEMNRLGIGGWEMVGVTKDSGFLKVFFKRAISPEEANTLRKELEAREKQIKENDRVSKSKNRNF